MWKKYYLLLGGLGFSYLGNWIYLVALNVYVLNLTNSAGAVAGIYIVGPVARIIISFVAGSIIDRYNKQRLMVWADVLRGSLIIILPFMDSIFFIYTILFMVNIAGSFFGPSSTFYITKYVEEKERKRFNALLGTFNSGSFLLGPALAGVIILFFNSSIAIWMNSVTFFVCAFIISRLPHIEEHTKIKRNPLTFGIVRTDFLEVWNFFKSDRSFTSVYIVFQMTLMIAFALDSQEVTFIKQNLGVSDSVYGVIVSLTGVGAIIGGIVAAALTTKISLKGYIGYGLFFTMLFYTLFYSSNTLWMAVLSFILLGFFMAFGNTGYETFYQKSIPTHLMGRFGSVATILQSILQITLTFILGLLSEIFNLQTIAVIMGLLSIVLSTSLLFVLYSTKLGESSY